MAGWARVKRREVSYPPVCLPHSHSGMARERQTRNLEIPGSPYGRPGMTKDGEAS